MVGLERKQIPNLITLLRFILIVPIFISLLQHEYRSAFFLILIAGLSDGVDGFLARRYQWISEFGTIADPIADKLLMLISYFCLTWAGLIPLWLFVLVIARDIWLSMGVIAYRYFIGNPHFKPSQISKLNTVMQIILVVVLLFNAGFVKLPQTFIDTVILLVLVTTVSSFIDYTYVWGRKACLALKWRKL